MFIYLVSSGGYSSYSPIGYFASEQRIEKAQFEEWGKEAQKLEAVNNYTSHSFDLSKFLIGKGFTIKYFAGEFHEDSLYFTEDIRDGDINEFRLGTA